MTHAPPFLQLFYYDDPYSEYNSIHREHIYVMFMVHGVLSPERPVTRIQMKVPTHVTYGEFFARFKELWVGAHPDWILHDMFMMVWNAAHDGNEAAAAAVDMFDMDADPTLHSESVVNALSLDDIRIGARIEAICECQIGAFRVINDPRQLVPTVFPNGMPLLSNLNPAILLSMPPDNRIAAQLFCECIRRYDTEEMAVVMDMLRTIRHDASYLISEDSTARNAMVHIVLEDSMNRLANVVNLSVPQLLDPNYGGVYSVMLDDVIGGRVTSLSGMPHWNAQSRTAWRLYLWPNGLVYGESYQAMHDGDRRNGNDGGGGGNINNVGNRGGIGRSSGLHLM